MTKKDYCCTLSAIGCIKELFLKVAQSLKVLDTLTNILASFLLMKMSEDIYFLDDCIMSIMPGK
jgi:hypothetical protein